MPHRDPNNVGIWEIVIFGCIAAIGGLLGYLMRAINSNQKITYTRAIIECASSGFVGVLAMFACLALHLNWMWSGLVVGVFGWLGAEASLAVFAKIIRKKLGIDIKHDK